MARPPKKNDRGLYFPMDHRTGDLSAQVVAVNDDDTLNLVVWDECGVTRPVLNVPSEENADDGVHFFRLQEPDGGGM